MRNYSSIISNLTLEDIFSSNKSKSSLSKSLDFALKYFSLGKDHSFNSLEDIEDIIKISSLYLEKNNGPCDDTSELTIQLIRELALKNLSVFYLLDSK
jgi:hypothetical protein